MTDQQRNTLNKNPSISSMEENSASRSGLWKPIALLGAVLAMLFLARFLGIGEFLAGLQDFIKNLGVFGPIVFVFIYAACTVAAIPGSALTLIAGAIFGSILGVIVVSISSTLGAALCFLIARYFAREAMAKGFAHNEKFQKLDRMTARNGAMIVAITRLVPIFPFNLLNYGFGLTRVSFGAYVLWSWICMLPGTILYVVGSDALTTGLTEGRIPWPLILAFAGILVALTVLVRYAKRKLDDSENDSKAELKSIL